MSIFTRLLPAPDKKFPPEPCPECPMQGARRVGARGTVDSPLVIILEAPGVEELKYGAPVCGPSGDLLDKSVPSDFDFDQAFIINAMQCRPPKTNDQHKDKAFKTRACVACRQRVLSQIFRYPRKAVLAMGAWSNSVLLQDYNFKITQKRGEVYAIVDPQTKAEVVVVPTVHPAFLLRGSGNLQVFKDDISLAHNLAFGVEVGPVVRKVDWYDPFYRVLDTLDDFVGYVRYLGELAEQRKEEGGGPLVIAADIETTGLRPWKDIIRGVGFYVDDGQDTAVIVHKRSLLDAAYCHYIREFLRDETGRFRFVWQNGKFDSLFLILEELLDRHQSVVHEDTLLLSYALSEATKDHDLDEQAKNYLGAPDHKWIVKKWGKNADDFYRNAPDHILFDYQAKDLKKTLLLYKHNRPAVAADKHLEKLYTRTLLPMSQMLVRSEEYGIYVDQDFVRINRFGATHQEILDLGLPLLYDEKDKKREKPLPEIGLENEMHIIENELAELVGRKVNPSSPDEVAELLYDEYKLTIKGRRPQNTRKETLEKLPPHPAVKLIRKFRAVRKSLGTYVAGVEKNHVDNVIHTTFKIHATTTGRLSSSEPNTQNIPRDPRLRRMYRARPGYVLLEADYNSAELRLLAVLSGDPTLTAIFLDDKRNLHDEVSVQMYGSDFTQDQRIRAKAINFGIPYGRDAYSIAVEFDIASAEAQRLIDSWFGQFPGARDFLRNSGDAAFKGRTLITVFGRKRRPGVVSPERLHGLQNEFKNFHMQSPISDFTCHSAIEMQDKLEEYDSHIVNLVHDSLVLEVPDNPEVIIPVANYVQEVMVEVPKRWIDTPIIFKTDLKIGKHWGLCPKYEKWLADYEQHKLVTVAMSGTNVDVNNERKQDGSQAGGEGDETKAGTDVSQEHSQDRTRDRDWAQTDDAVGAAVL